MFGVGTIGVLYTMASWWGDVIKEAQYKGGHTRVVQISHRYGMILFIASEVMFFVAWFWAFFNSALFPADAVHATRDAVFGCGPGTAMGACCVPGTWPPKGIETFDPWHLPLLNTLLLLTSGTTVTWAHHALLEGDRQGLKQGLILTVILGACFTCVQAYEYRPCDVLVRRQRLRRDLLHGDRVPRLPRAGRHHLPAGLPDPAPMPATSRRSSTSASSSPPGTGTSSTWSGCSCSSASTSWGHGAEAMAHGARTNRRLPTC